MLGPDGKSCGHPRAMKQTRKDRYWELVRITSPSETWLLLCGSKERSLL